MTTKEEFRVMCCFCGESVDPPQVPKALILEWGDGEDE